MTQQEFIELMSNPRLTKEERDRIHKEYIGQSVMPTYESTDTDYESWGDEDEESEDEAGEERNAFNRIYQMIEFFSPSSKIVSTYKNYKTIANNDEYHIKNNEMLKSILNDKIFEIGEKGVAKVISENYSEIYTAVDRAQHESGTHGSYIGTEVHPAITRFAEILKGGKLEKEDYDSLERLREDL